MYGMTMEELVARRQLWLDADAAVARNQSYSMPDGRNLSRADATVIRENIQFWDRQIARKQSGGVRVRYGIT